MVNRRAISLLAIAAGLVGCGQGAMTHREQAPPPRPAPPDAGVIWTPTPKATPLVIPRIEAKPARWKEEPNPKATVQDRLAPREPHSLGTGAAVVRGGDYLAVLTRERGVISIFEGKGIAVRLMKGDAALIAVGGALHRAPDPAAISRLSKNPELSGAPSSLEHWDAAGRFVAVANGNVVHVSTNGGTRFRKTRLPGRNRQVETILVRPDGVMVAVSGSTPKDRVTFVSRRGSRWRRASFQPGRPLVRYGSWIHDSDGDCTAVLAGDGQRWLRVDWTKRFGALWSWRGLTQIAPTAYGVPPGIAHPTAATPPAPAKAKQVFRGSDKKCSPSGGGSGYGVGSGRGGGASGALKALRSTRWPEPVETPTAVAFLWDAVCPHKDFGCDFSAPRARKPGMVRFSRLPAERKVELLHVPTACASPRKISEVQGLGVLTCIDGDGTRMFGIGTPAKVVAEGRISAKADTLAGFAIAADGTVGLVQYCSKGTCRGWIRRDNSWHELTVPGAVAYRFLSRSRALVLVAESETKRTAKVRLDLFEGNKTRTLVRSIELDEPPRTFELDDKGHVVLGFPGTHGKLVVKMVGTRGELIEPR